MVELKKGGFSLSQKELDQARDYARELYKGVDVLPTTETVAYVLGAKAEQGLSEAVYGKVITVVPMLYRTLLDNAQARTFNLQRQLEKLGLTLKIDPEVQDIFKHPSKQSSPKYKYSSSVAPSANPNGFKSINPGLAVRAGAARNANGRSAAL